MPRDQPQQSNEDLLLRYQRTDLTGFDLFYRQNHGLIFNFLLARLGNRADAEEAFQETFLRLHRAIATYNPEQKALAWVFTIARNAAIDLMRRRGSRRPTGGAEDVSFDPRVEVALAARETLISLMATLTLEERDLLTGRFFNEESYEEISGRLRVKTEVVRQRVSRLIKKIKAAGGTFP